MAYHLQRLLIQVISFLILLVRQHQVLASGRRPFPPWTREAGDSVFSLPAGVCSTASVNGYKCQEFEVTTVDGYILGVQRIQGSRANGPPVLLQHGLLVVSSLDHTCLALMCFSFSYEDGMTWLLNSVDQSLALILASDGFDVWISNLRGTRMSRRHMSMEDTDPEYWNWTWDELVMYDLPSVIGLIFRHTEQEIHYVGHSMGTLIALASFSEGRQLEKVKSAALLCPIAYLNYMNTALGVVAARAFVGELTTIFGLAEFNPKGELAAYFLKALCMGSGIDCYDLLTAITGKNCCLNSSTVELFLKHEPQSTSTKNLVHLAQTARDGILSKYNYGTAAINLVHYGGSKPPVYDLSKIPRDLPLFLSYGGQDALSDVKDVSALLDSLKLHDVGKLHVQYIEEYAHADFIMGITAKDLVYNKMREFFRRYNN